MFVLSSYLTVLKIPFTLVFLFSHTSLIYFHSSLLSPLSSLFKSLTLRTSLNLLSFYPFFFIYLLAFLSHFFTLMSRLGLHSFSFRFISYIFPLILFYFILFSAVSFVLTSNLPSAFPPPLRPPIPPAPPTLQCQHQYDTRSAIVFFAFYIFRGCRNSICPAAAAGLAPARIVCGRDARPAGFRSQFARNKGKLHSMLV